MSLTTILLQKLCNHLPVGVCNLKNLENLEKVIVISIFIFSYKNC